MSKRTAVLSSLLFATILLSPLASADVTEETISFSPITSYELGDIVISGYVEPNVETTGRVCYPDCEQGQVDRYDFWYLNASIGTRLEVSFTTLNDPDFVSLDVEHCFLDERNHTTFHCRHWHTTEDPANSFTDTLDNVYGQFALRISPNDGFWGDDTRYNLEFSVNDNPDPVTDIFNKHSFIEEPVNTTFTIEDSVCWFTCDEYNSMDLYDIYLVKGDSFGFELTSLYNESNEFDRGILHVYVMEINEYYSATRTLTEYRMNEQDSLTVGVQETESVVLRVKVAIKENSNSGDHFGYQIKFHINNENRDLNQDTDLDGYPDRDELSCSSETFLGNLDQSNAHKTMWENSSQLPDDMDSDFLCDDVDYDIDGDGYSNLAETSLCDTTSDPLDDQSFPADLDGDFRCDGQDSDLDGDGVINSNDVFPLDASEWSDNDGDETGDNADFDDDNDGYLDNNDAFPFDSTEWDDTDSDNIGDNTDTDDDGDGYSDVYEIGCDSEPLDATSKPEDFDNDFLPDCIDLDLDNDGVDNAEDAFDYDSNAWTDTDEDGLADDLAGGYGWYFLSAVDSLNEGGHYITVSNHYLHRESTVLCEIGTYSSNPLDNWEEDSCTFYVGTEDAHIEYVSGEEYYYELTVRLTSPNGLETDISPSAPFGPEILAVISTNSGPTQLDYDDDNDGYLDVDETECGSDPLNALSRPVDSDGDFQPDCVDNDNDNDGWTDLQEIDCGTLPFDDTSIPLDLNNNQICDSLDVAEQGEEDCFIGECFFDQHFKFLGKPVSEVKTVEGNDPSLGFMIFFFLSLAPLATMYVKSDRMFVQWEEASSQNKYSEKRKLEKEFSKFESGGTDFNALNFYAVWSMLAALFFGLVLFRELALIFFVGLTGLLCLLYLNIPEHFAAKRWADYQSAPSGQGLPPQPAPPPLGKPTQSRVTNPMPPQPTPLPTQKKPYNPIVSKPWDAHKAPETELYEPTTPKSTQQKPPKKIDQNDFKLFSETQLSRLYRSKSQKLIKKEPLNKIGKLTLSNEVKILRKLSKAGLGYQVVEGSNQGSKNPILIMPDLGSQSLLDVVEHLSSSERKNFIHVLSSAIQELHAQNIVHRDLKLGNIMINEKNGTKTFSSLIDFGTAMKAGTAQTEHLLGGTRPYMHPSQHLQDAKAHEGQDWYAFARILVVLTGACKPEGLESYLMDGIETKVDHKLRQIGYRDFEVQIIQQFVNVATKPSADDAKSLNMLTQEGLKVSKIV